jgi:hypothetical protein
VPPKDQIFAFQTSTKDTGLEGSTFVTMKIKQVIQEGKPRSMILFEDVTHLIQLDCSQTKASNTESALVSYSYESRGILQEIDNANRALQENSNDKRGISDSVFALNK